MKKHHRGIYLLPNLFTTTGLFAGFYAIISAMNGDYRTAAIAVFIAMVMDGLDGRIARLTNTQSDFGAQYDSLSDMVCFGLAPALIVYQWSLVDLGKFGWLGAFMFAAAAALRLARFNTQASHEDKQYFQGLASPAAAALVAGFIWLIEDFHLAADLPLEHIAFAITVLAGSLMVTNIRYLSFKQVDLKGRVPFLSIIALMFLFIIIAISPPLVLFGMALCYAISGPIITLLLIRRRRAQRRQQYVEDSSETGPNN